MKYFLDTEFIEKPGSITLISIGLVAEDGREYHAISNDYIYGYANDWVKDNVLKPLYIHTVHGDQRNFWDADNFQHHYGKSPNKIGQEIFAFTGQTALDETTEDCEFYGYFADYDWVVFCWLFGTMMDLPRGYPMYCMDLKQMMKDRGLTREWKDENCPEPEHAHNAIVDAKWNKKLYEKILLTNFNPLKNR